MSETPSAPQADIAIPKTISFRPGSLHDAAVAYGKAQTPELNPSVVVCTALQFFFEAKGFVPASATKRAEILAAIDEVGEDRALTLLRRATRRPVASAA